MTKWEYCKVHYLSSDDSRELSFFQEKEEPRHYKGDEADLIRHLNWLGEAGWEAFGVASHLAIAGDASARLEYFVFKRPKL